MLANVKDAGKALWFQGVLMIAATIGITWAGDDTQATILAYSTSVLGGLIAGNALLLTSVHREEARQAFHGAQQRELEEALGRLRQVMDEQRAWEESLRERRLAREEE